jgi:hypothetical protein
MYQEVLRSIEGIGMYPAVSLVVFIAVFTAIVIYAMRMDSADAEIMAGLPLDQDETPFDKLRAGEVSR